MPLAKWAMLLAGNYRCVTKDGMRTAQEAVHSDIETSRSVYNFVNDLCVKLGADPDDLVPFEKYAAAAQSLVRPASAARALNNGVPNIERADKLVQLIAKQKGLSHPVIDAGVALVDAGSRPTARRRPPPDHDLRAEWDRMATAHAVPPDPARRSSGCFVFSALVARAPGNLSFGVLDQDVVGFGQEKAMADHAGQSCRGLRPSLTTSRPAGRGASITGLPLSVL